MGKLQRSSSPRFDTTALRDLAGTTVYGRGEGYFRAGQVNLVSDNGHCIRARVIGTEVYRVELRGGAREIAGSCSCPAFTDHGFCKHLVAVALAANAAGARGDAVPDRIGIIRSHLRSQSAERLIDMILEAAERDPALLDRLDLAASASFGDRVEIGARCKAALKRALRTGRFVDYADAGGWAHGVLNVLNQMESLIDAGHAALVLDLLTDFFPAVARALQNVDDSDGGGGEILARAASLHLSACNAASPDPVLLARELFRLETTEEFGSFSGASDTYGDILGTAGLEEYRQLATAAWNAVPKHAHRRGTTEAPQDGDLIRYRLFPILDSFAARDGDLKARIALREALLVHPHDYLRLAEFCLAQGLEAEAVRRAEEGAWLFDDISGEPLLLFLAGRHLAAGAAQKAESALWPAFERRPSMRVYAAMAEARAGDGEALAALTGRAVELLHTRLAPSPAKAVMLRNELAGLLVEILIREKRLKAAWEAARRYGCPDSTWLQLAAASETDTPEDAITVYTRLIDQQIGLTNKYGYNEACRLIARIGAIRVRAGESASHSSFVEELLQRHGSKRSFVAMVQEQRSGWNATMRRRGGQ